MAVVINYDQLQKERTIRPRSPQEKAFANDQLIPFYNKMIDRYSPNAIVLVMVNICSPLKELETVERGVDKGHQRLSHAYQYRYRAAVHDGRQLQPRYSVTLNRIH